MNFIDPRMNYAFKRIFGSSESKEILISFLNALIYENKAAIEDLEIIDPYLPPKALKLKDTYLDVRAKLKDGTFVIIEMQVLNVQSFGKRVIFNAAKTYSLQLQAGEGYFMLKPVIALTLTDFEMFPNHQPFISRFVYRERDNGYTYPENDIDLVFVELPKFNKDLPELETVTDKWIYFIKYARSLTEIPDSLEEIPELHRAFEIADRARLTTAELEDLERQEMFIYDQRGAIALGREEGREEGKTEEKYAIARNLLSLLDNAAIAQTTGLTLEEIQALREGS